jgi:hypothetical protein
MLSITVTYIALNVRKLVSNKFEKIWKEEIVA